MDRQAFLKSLIGISGLASINFDQQNDNIAELINSAAKSTSGSMIGHKVDPIDKVKIGIIGMGNRGSSLLEMLEYNIKNETAEIIGFSDLKEDKVNKAAKKIDAWQKKQPKLYYGNETEWKKLVERDDIDLILVTTPWEYHTPMSLYSMEQGKHVASEVPIACSLSECWEIVQTAERTKKHCIMLENCCYNAEEMWILNMVQQGVFGDITHAEGAYLHDLRALLISDDYYEDQWRMKHHTTRDGNLYTTHGLGPIATYLNLGRGDTMKYLTSMSSRELNLSETATIKGSPYTDIKCGDMNNTMIKTEKGKTILLQFDVHTGRPYSRINKVVGTKAVHDGYPSRLYIDDRENLVFWGHKWLSDEDYKSYKSKYEHPLIAKLKDISQGFKQGHGGMDFVMMWRLITCLNKGLPLDLNVYDGAYWTAVTPLSEISVASNSMPVPIPDFMNGRWKEKQSLEIMRDID
jgi:predicted dehydrogenase